MPTTTHAQPVFFGRHVNISLALGRIRLALRAGYVLWHDQDSTHHIAPLHLRLITHPTQPLLPHTSLESNAVDTLTLRRVPQRVSGTSAQPDSAIIRVAILDTETTGLVQETDTIIELAILVIDVDSSTGLPAREVARYEGLEDCEGELSAEVIRVTGITKSMIAGQRLDDHAVATAMVGVDVVIAHNAGFDRKFVEKRFPEFVDRDWACSIQEVDWSSLGIESSKLDYIAFKRGYFFDAHRAIADCLAVAVVLTTSHNDEAPPMLRLLESVSELSFELWARRAPFEAKDAMKARGYRWDADVKCWHCNVRGKDLARAEWRWLQAEVYGRGAPSIEVLVHNARSRYSVRPGAPVEPRAQ